MITGVAAFLAGVVLLQWQASLPLPGLLLLILPLLYLARRYPTFLLPALFGLGYLWALLHAHWLLSRELPAELEGLDVRVQGVISGLPVADEDRVSFDLSSDRMVAGGVEIQPPGMIRLNWYGKVPPLVPGEHWRLMVRLKRPHGFMNPGGFDYEGWLFRNRIRARGYVREDPDNRRLAGSSPIYALQRLRHSIRGLIERQFSNRQAEGQLKALVIGDRDGLSRSDWELFRATGTNHLVAISGLHIGIVAGLAFFLGRRVWTCSSHLLLLYPAPVAGAVFALAMATLYAGLAGFSIPTQRALIMLSVVMGAVLMKRQLAPLRSISSALLLVLLFDPLAVLSPGFWLSFLAVGVILFGISGQLHRPGLIRSWMGTQWFIALGLAPVLLAAHLEVPLVAPLVNLFAVPFYSLIVIPLALCGTLLSLIWEVVGLPLLQLAAWFLDISREVLILFAEPGLSFSLPGKFPPYLWAGVGSGTLLLLSPVGMPGRWLGVILLLPLGLLSTTKTPQAGELWFDLLDVGQGLSAVIQTRHHLLVYDAGPRFSAGFDAGSAVLVPFLQQRGINTIHKVVLSNGDDDHQGGFLSLKDHFPLGEVLSGEPQRIKGGDAKYCRAGDQWSWDGAHFEFLHPQDPGAWSGNDASCVLRVTHAAGSLLLSGDIESAAEYALLREHRAGLRADLVLVPHHGSRTSSTQAFVEQVGPRYALVSSGYINRYRFPREEVVARWEKRGAKVLNTANSGAIHFRMGADGRLYGPESYRETAKRYWHMGTRKEE